MNGKKEKNDKIRTLLADDHAITRMGLKSVLDMCPDIAVVGEAEDGADAVRRTKALAPDVVVMDLMMPGMDGTEATRALAQEVPSARVLILTTFGTADGIAHALEAGAAGAASENNYAPATTRQARPAMKRTNIARLRTFAARGAPRNSCQIKMPQSAETSVAPCPSAYEIALPAAPAETNESSVPSPQIAPPSAPTRWIGKPPLK